MQSKALFKIKISNSQFTAHHYTYTFRQLFIKMEKFVADRLLLVKPHTIDEAKKLIKVLEERVNKHNQATTTTKKLSLVEGVRNQLLQLWSQAITKQLTWKDRDVRAIILYALVSRGVKPHDLTIHHPLASTETGTLWYRWSDTVTAYLARDLTERRLHLTITLDLFGPSGHLNNFSPMKAHFHHNTQCEVHLGNSLLNPSAMRLLPAPAERINIKNAKSCLEAALRGAPPDETIPQGNPKYKQEHHEAMQALENFHRNLTEPQVCHRLLINYAFSYSSAVTNPMDNIEESTITFIKENLMEEYIVLGVQVAVHDQKVPTPFDAFYYHDYGTDIGNQGKLIELGTFAETHLL
ncbi:hypothetical protein FGO68_gene7861 [Halteria grandinella]|uniref:Uncharacterized protein n=1 Tax=Halteria grandinella TaxID=5974 RepID=A0A8J8NLJ1_HALGN|nr:hypothetical protein FGO68_gene7861 [Halteria grandinella]